eukprot:m.126112 g.126112  ORF g.126112 m.126112 type:complete len:124 (-) comp13818_c1_seq4:372-743(-)
MFKNSFYDCTSSCWLTPHVFMWKKKLPNTATDPPYWRGPIWININYLAVRALKYYGIQEGPYQQRALELHDRLRSNLIDNIFRQYKKSGFIWEQYNDQTGEGKGSHPFTGWSALVVALMANSY